MDNELPMLIKRCLTYGIKIYPYQLNGIMQQYGEKTIPDNILCQLKDYQVIEYVQGLYLSSQESAGDWTRGHEILKRLGFSDVFREEGHRRFVKLVFNAQTENA